MTLKHSPGPWAQDGIEYWADIIGHYGEAVAMVHSDHIDEQGAPDMERARANARLIAQSPALAKALRALLCLHGATHHSHPEHIAAREVLRAAFESATP